MSPIPVARMLSIVGHPALLMPLGIALAAWHRQAPVQVMAAALAASAFVAGCVIAYSLWQVRAGRWVHVDASVPAERGQLNVFLVLLLFGTAAGLAAAGQPSALWLGLAAAGAVVVLALGLRAWLKVSLHAAFAVLAASLVWPAPAAIGLLLLALAVGWSRLVLRRHTRAEVAVGLLAGALAGAALVQWAR